MPENINMLVPAPAPFGREKFRLTKEEEERLRRRISMVPTNTGQGPLVHSGAVPTDFTPQLEATFPSFIGPLEEDVGITRSASPVQTKKPKLVPSPINTKGMQASRVEQGVVPQEVNASLADRFAVGAQRVGQRIAEGARNVAGQFKDELKDEGTRNLLLDVTGAQLANLGASVQDPTAPVRGIQGAVANQRAREAADAQGRRELAIEQFKEQGRQARANEQISAMRDIAEEREKGLNKRHQQRMDALLAKSQQAEGLLTGTDLKNSQVAIGSVLGMDLETVGSKSYQELLSEARKQGAGKYESVAREISRQSGFNILGANQVILGVTGAKGSAKDKADVLISQLQPLSTQFREGWLSAEVEAGVREVAKGASNQQKIELEAITGLRLTPSRLQEKIAESFSPDAPSVDVIDVGKRVGAFVGRVAPRLPGAARAAVPATASVLKQDTIFD